MSHKLYEFETVYLKQQGANSDEEKPLVSQNNVQVILEFPNFNRHTAQNISPIVAERQYDLIVVPSQKIEIVVESNCELDIQGLLAFFTDMQYQVLDMADTTNTKPAFRNDVYIYQFEIQCRLNMHNCMKPYHEKAIKFKKQTHAYANMVQLSINCSYHSISPITQNRCNSMFQHYMNSLIISNLEYSYPLCYNRVIRDKCSQHLKYQTEYNKLNLNFTDILMIMLKSKENTTFIKMLQNSEKYDLPIKKSSSSFSSTS